MSDPESKPKSRHDALPKMRTPSGRFVYDPAAAPEVGGDPVKLRGLIEGMERIENMDARDAVPAPVAAQHRSDGAIMVAGDDAARAHAEAMIAPKALPDVPSRPVRIAEAVDPRRQPTRRMGRPTGAAAAALVNEVALASTTKASANDAAPVRRKPKAKRGMVWAGGAVTACVIGLFLFVALRPRDHDGNDSGASDGPLAPTMAPFVSTGDTSPASSVPAVPSAAPSTSASTSPSTHPTVTSAPKASVKPKVPTAPPAVPSTTPSAAPSVTPPATITEPSGSAPDYVDP